MLNEIKECEEYLTIDKCNTPRLSYALFMKSSTNGYPKFQGLSRALIILARYYLFTENNYLYPENIDGNNLSEQRKRLREIVESKLQDWMKGPLVTYLKNEEEKLEQKESTKRKKLETKEKNKKSIEEIVSDRIRYWDKPIYSILAPASRKSRGNTENAISLSILIATAINQGPLQNRCLIMKADALNDITYFSSDKSNNRHSLSVSLSDKSAKYLDRLLKYIAGTMPEVNGYDPANDGQFLPVGKTNLAYWTQYPSLARNRNTLYVDPKGEMIIEYDYARSLSRVNPEFIKQYDVKTMPTETAEKLINTPQYKDYLFFEDNGVNLITEKNTKI